MDQSPLESWDFCVGLLRVQQRTFDWACSPTMSTFDPHHLASTVYLSTAPGFPSDRPTYYMTSHHHILDSLSAGSLRSLELPTGEILHEHKLRGRVLVLEVRPSILEVFAKDFARLVRDGTIRIALLRCARRQNRPPYQYRACCSNGPRHGVRGSCLDNRLKLPWYGTS